VKDFKRNRLPAGGFCDDLDLNEQLQERVAAGGRRPRARNDGRRAVDPVTRGQAAPVPAPPSRGGARGASDGGGGDRLPGPRREEPPLGAVHADWACRSRCSGAPASREVRHRGQVVAMLITLTKPLSEGRFDEKLNCPKPACPQPDVGLSNRFLGRTVYATIQNSMPNLQWQRVRLSNTPTCCAMYAGML